MPTLDTSAVGISNLALARLGEASIRDFLENNKRSRLCKSLYPQARDWCLAKYNWSFARKIQVLNLISPEPAEEEKLAYFVYGIPSDCMAPIQVLPAPRTRRKDFYLVGDRIHTNTESAYLLYTVEDPDPSTFNPPFVATVASYLAHLLAHGLVQDKELSNVLRQEAEQILLVSTEEDATLGSDFLHFDRDPNNDSFVYPDAIIEPNVDKSRYLAE
jgi:hypothetical protein